MNDTQIRDTLDVVSDAVVVPAPDALAFESRVRHVRRRRHAVHAATASLAVAGIALGATLVRGGSEPSTVPADPITTAPPATSTLPVLVRGRLTSLAADGTLAELGPKVARIVGSTADGPVVFAMNGDLARVTEDGTVRRLVDDAVRRAYVAEGGVLFQTFDGVVHRSATDGSAGDVPTDGMLIAAAQDTYVIAGEGGGSGLVAHDPEGEYELPLVDDGGGEVVQQVEIGGGRIAVHLQGGIQIFEQRGKPGASLADGGTGALAPDGSAYAMAPNGADLAAGAARGLRLVDPHTGDTSRVAGPDGPAVDLLWLDESTLLLIEGDDTDRRLWRCDDGGRACAVLLDDPTGTLLLPVSGPA